MPNRAFIGLGTNLGDRLANYQEAIERIGKIAGCRVLRQSSIYETEPVDDPRGRPYLNGAIEVETELSAEELMHKLLSIERAMGRKPAQRRTAPRRTTGKVSYKPRIIDLDLLFFNKEIFDTNNLTVPHPALHERRFVLSPLSELAPALVHPKLNASVSELLAGLKSPYRVSLMRTDMLRSTPPKREVASR